MATVHVLSQSDDQAYRCVIHFPIPAGSNSAGFTWKAVALAAGVTGVTRLVEGSGPGQITTAEKAQVLAGDVGEFEIALLAESGGQAAAQLGAAVDALAVSAIADYQARVARQLKWYGATRT